MQINIPESPVLVPAAPSTPLKSPPNRCTWFLGGIMVGVALGMLLSRSIVWRANHMKDAEAQTGEPGKGLPPDAKVRRTSEKVLGSIGRGEGSGYRVNFTWEGNDGFMGYVEFDLEGSLDDLKPKGERSYLMFSRGSMQLHEIVLPPGPPHAPEK